MEIGEVTEYFSKNNACIINIKSLIKCNDTVLCEKNGDWIKATINSIQLNDAKVETTDTGECGIVFDRIIKKGYKIYKRQ
ncbi:hypothetical protein SDC9_175332 [bioreactor metagenome]|uniref:Uncharacterized protein n=1 Tax=bioreactor metagenome TaxID=1076179 RepID=A0A645GLV3_9ZZZZ